MKFKKLIIISFLCLSNVSYAEVSGGDVTLGDLKTAIYYLLQDTKENKKLLEQFKKETNNKIENNTTFLQNQIRDTSNKLDVKIKENNNSILELNKKIYNLKKDIDKKFKKQEREIIFVHNEVKTLENKINSNIKLIQTIKNQINKLELKNGDVTDVNLTTPYDDLLKSYISKKEKLKTIKAIEEKFNKEKKVLNIKFFNFKNGTKENKTQKGK